MGNKTSKDLTENEAWATMSTEKKDEVKQLAKKHKMKELEVVAARLAFSKYDKDSNGQLDRAEIENVIQETQSKKMSDKVMKTFLDKAFDTYDTDKVNKLLNIKIYLKIVKKTNRFFSILFFK